MTLNRAHLILASVTLSILTCTAYAQRPKLPYILDMVHNNPGETPYITKYNDPNYMVSQGFTGMVTQWFVNCAITYDNYQKDVVVPGTEERKWIEQKAADIDEKLKACKKAGIKVYPFTDFIVFPVSIWKVFGKEITGSPIVGKFVKPNMQNKRTQDLLRAQIAGIFDRFPQLDGLTLRFGETYLQDTPYHIGGGPIRAGEAGIADQITMINILREEICVKRHKMLFYRTWDFGYNFHNNPNYYLQVTDHIKPHPNLIFVVKYQQGDFHRMTPFNPTIGIGKHQQMIEAQSRMEAYGKGAHPYYTAKGVIDGWPETKYEITFDDQRFTGRLNDPMNPRGIKDVLKNKLLKGVMTWSNGGGWDGPYTTSELWTDLNTYVLSHWAQHPDRSEESLFYEFAAKLGLHNYEAELFRRLCLLTVEGVRKGQLNSFVSNAVWWSRDQYFSAAENRKVIEEIIREGKIKEVLAEKAESVAIWLQIEALSKQIHIQDPSNQEAMEVSCTYGRIKYQLIEQMWILMIENAKREGLNGIDKQVIKTAINRYDKLWAEWRDLKTSSKYCATLYTDKAFRNERKGSIGELVDHLRIEIDNVKNEK